MDAFGFDALARALSSAGTRRSLVGLLVPLLGLPLTQAMRAQDSGRRGKRTARPRGARIEGPCGNGSDRANRCRRNRQCCTGYCKKAKKKHKNGKKRTARGRCRCRRDGQSCDAARQCCPELTSRICKAGTCQDPLCVDLCPEGCCAGATCAPGTSPEACGPDGETCLVCGTHEACEARGCVCTGDVCAIGCPYRSLQDAIDAASAGDTIRLCAETYAGSFTIDRDLTLIGAGAARTRLDGEESGRVLHVTGDATVTLQNLTITGGRVSGSVPPAGDGGGIYNHGAVILRGVSVTTNFAFTHGGGIYNSGGTLTLLDGSLVSDNTAFTGGGGLYSTGGLVTLSAGSHVTRNDVFISGGGIHQEVGTLTLEQESRVTRNISVTSGGGIFVQDGTLDLQSGSRVSGNEARVGGAIAVEGGTVTLGGGSRLSDNEAAHGGGIFGSGGQVTLQTGSRVSENKAVSSGGGITTIGAAITLEAGAIVCNNTSPGAQCAGPIDGACPHPANGICPD